jgi:tetratricopeptide (TPR) repeat protein
VENRDGFWYFLRGEVYLAKKEYAPAAEHFRKAEDWNGPQVYSRLEECYRELGDFEEAYYYIRKSLTTG